MIAEESTAWPGVTRPTAPRRPGLRPQVEHGLDARLARLPRARADPPAVPPRRDHLLAVYAWSEKYVLPISHDEVVHGKGSLLSKMPGDRWQQLATLRALPRLHVGAPRQAAALHGLRVRAGAPSGPRTAAWTGGCSTTPTTAGVQRLVARPQPGLPRRPRRCGRATTSPAASSGSTPTTPAATSSPSCAGTTTAAPLVCVANFSGVPHERYRIGLPSAGAGTRCSTPTRRSTAAPASATSARSTADDEPWHGRPLRPPRRAPARRVWLRPA